MTKYIKIISSVIILFSINIFSQNNSIYSKLGIGDMVYSYSARSLGMGQLGNADAVPDFVNTLNPANWMRIDKTRFEIGVDYTGLMQSSNSQNAFSGRAEFRGFTLAFPVSSTYGIGIAMGLVPYSRVSYDVSSNYNSPAANVSNYQVSYIGSGGLSKTFIGTSFKFPFGLAVGATMDYYFGNISYSSQVNFASTSDVSTNYQKNYNPDGLGTTVGLISPDFAPLFKSKSIADVRLGFSLSYISPLSTDTISTSNNIITTDTIASGTAQMKIPVRFSGGLSFVLNEKYLFTMDYLSQAWQNYSFGNVKSQYLQNAYKISAGFEYRPLQDNNAGFTKNIIWRAGLSYEQTPFILDYTSIYQYSISGGVSLPLSYQNTVDIGLQYSTRGKSTLDLVKENSFRVDFSLSLGQLWFSRSERY